MTSASEGNESVSTRMKRDWDRRAGEDYKLHIATGASFSDEDFQESGAADLFGVILDGIDLDPSAEVLEIGCGVGRLLMPLADRVSVAHGVDISEVMIEKSREFCAKKPNIRTAVTDGTLSHLPDGSLDAVFSFIVFQHIPELGPIEAYAREAARVLRPGGIFRFQVDGRWERFHGHSADTYNGVKLSPLDVAELTRGAELSLVEQWGEETHYHWVTARKPGSGARVRFEPRSYDPTLLFRYFERLALPDGDAAASRILRGESGLRRELGAIEDRFSALSDEDFVRELSIALLGHQGDTPEFHVRLLKQGLEYRHGIVDSILAGAPVTSLLRPARVDVPWFRRLAVDPQGNLPSGADLFALANEAERLLAEQVPEGAPPEDVVRRAFALVLGESPDEEGLRYHASRIARSPFGRRLVLRDLLTAPFQVPPPPSPSARTAMLEKIANPSPAPHPGESFPGEAAVARDVLREAGEANDRDFVRLAYGRILRREPDEGGASWYCGRLASSALNRPGLVRELLWSDELRK